MTDKELVLRNIKKRYGIIGDCEGLNDALITAQKVAQSGFSVLVQGENGVGKEIIPRIIHDLSPRSNRKYLAVNCGAIPEGTIESELFGHVKGAYTGSVENREGYFAAADGGTLFLDEVGELPLQMQVRLLRVLETHEFLPVGSSEVRKTNVRIIAATNRDMRKAIAEGRFREDLYYRLAVVNLHIPPLRERGKDIDLIFRKFALENQERFGIPAIRLTEDARRLLLQYPWPGNVRQLKNVVDSMTVQCENREINAEELAKFIPADHVHTQISTVSPENLPAKTGSFTQNLDTEALMHHIKELTHQVAFLTEQVKELWRRVDHASENGHEAGQQGTHLVIGRENTRPADTEEVEFEDINGEINGEIIGDNPMGNASSATPHTREEAERALIEQALRRNRNNRRKTAEELAISERTLYRKIQKYGLDEED